jgi:hypothetical protein
VQISRIIDDEVFYRQATNASLVRQVIDSQSSVHQARWLKGEWVVTTLGWRNDKVKSYRKNDDNNVRNQYNFVDRASPNFVLPSTPGSVFEQAIWSHGFVVHRPPFLKFVPGVDFSVFYSKSENFQPADARIDIFGKAIQPPGGTTTDRGFTLGFLGGRLQTRFNWFETQSERATDTYPNFLIETDARIVRYNSPAALAAAGYKGSPQFLKALINWQEFTGPPTALAPSGVNVTYTVPGNMRDTTSTASKGFEFESIYNPTNQWRIAFNVSQQLASQADIAPASQEFLKLRLAEWTTGAASNLIADESGQPVRIRVYDTLLNALNGKLARSGQRVFPATPASAAGALARAYAGRTALASVTPSSPQPSTARSSKCPTSSAPTTVRRSSLSTAGSATVGKSGRIGSTGNCNSTSATSSTTIS